MKRRVKKIISRSLFTAAVVVTITTIALWNKSRETSHHDVPVLDVRKVMDACQQALLSKVNSSQIEEWQFIGDKPTSNGRLFYFIAMTKEKTSTYTCVTDDDGKVAQIKGV
jgi:hypothetical protein